MNSSSFTFSAWSETFSKVMTVRCFSTYAISGCYIAAVSTNEKRSAAGSSRKVRWFGLMGLDVCRQSDAVTVTQSGGTSLARRRHDIHLPDLLWPSNISWTPPHTHIRTPANEMKVDEKQQQRPSPLEINAAARVSGTTSWLAEGQQSERVQPGIPNELPKWCVSPKMASYSHLCSNGTMPCGVGMLLLVCFLSFSRSPRDYNHIWANEF